MFLLSLPALPRCAAKPKAAFGFEEGNGRDGQGGRNRIGKGVCDRGRKPSELLLFLHEGASGRMANEAAGWFMWNKVTASVLFWRTLPLASPW